MKEMQFESLGLKGKIMVPETAEEFDQLAKKPGACVEEAVSNVLYRGVLADVRGLLVDRVQKDTGKARQTKDDPKGNKYKNDQKDDAGNVIAKAGDPIQVLDETEAEYLRRVAAESGKDITSFQSTLDALLAEKDDQGNPLISFDPSQKERKAPTAAGPTKADVAAAATIQQAPEEKFNQAIARIATLVGHDVDANKAKSDVNYLAGEYRLYRLELSKADQLLK